MKAKNRGWFGWKKNHQVPTKTKLAVSPDDIIAPFLSNRRAIDV